LAIETTVVGSYPKPPAEGTPFRLRKTLHAVERGEATPDDLEDARNELVREVISEQEAAGIDIVTDGQARWDDLVTPFARNMAGFEVGGLLRWFDNNVYYRRPVCVGPLEWRGPSSVEAFTYAQSVASTRVKAVVPGPVTFAHLSVDEHYKDHERFVLALASVLAQEAFELEAAGATIIQFDEPALLGAPEDLDLARRALEVVTAELGSTETLVATYFGDAKRLGADLFRLPVAGFHLDLVAGPENWELLREWPSDRRLQAGVLNARNTRLESEGDLNREIERLTDLVGDELRVAPSCGLEFLPREKARAKLGLLGRLSERAGA
jgi:5-methyltetrahydropteroyltriglutamate--homocysteine methyltransferase